MEARPATSRSSLAIAPDATTARRIAIMWRRSGSRSDIRLAISWARSAVRIASLGLIGFEREAPRPRHSAGRSEGSDAARTAKVAPHERCRGASDGRLYTAEGALVAFASFPSGPFACNGELTPLVP